MESQWILIDEYDHTDADQAVVRLTYAMPLGHGVLVHVRESKGGNSAIATTSTFVPGVELRGNQITPRKPHGPH